MNYTIDLCLLSQDVMVLNDIIDQVSERPMSKATHFSSAYQVTRNTLDGIPGLHGHNVYFRMMMTRDPR